MKRTLKTLAKSGVIAIAILPVAMLAGIYIGQILTSLN
jgi:hypothetical protein